MSNEKIELSPVEAEKKQVNVFTKKCLAYLTECNFQFPNCDIERTDKTTVKFTNANHIKNLPVGSHIQVPFLFMKDGARCVAQHHAIYIGKNEEEEDMVIDILKTYSPNKQAIQIRKLETVFDMNDVDKTYQINNYENDNDEIRQSTVRCAELLCNSNFHYHIWFFNCEHFATFCRTGIPRYSSTYKIYTPNSSSYIFPKVRTG